MEEIHRYVVCAAMRKKGGYIICGPRHGDCMRQIRSLFGDITEEWEMGFVDQHNVFMTRREAWVVANASLQIRRPLLQEEYSTQIKRFEDDGKIGLCSENLY